MSKICLLPNKAPSLYTKQIGSFKFSVVIASTDHFTLRSQSFICNHIQVTTEEAI